MPATRRSSRRSSSKATTSPVKKKKAPAKKTTKAKARAKTPAKKKKKKAKEPAPEADDAPNFVVDKILEVRKNKRKNEYLVSWKGYPESDNTWELGIDMKKDGHGEAIKAFRREQRALKASPAPAKAATPVKATTPAKATPAKATTPAATAVEEIAEEAAESPNAGVNTPGSFAFYWAVMIGIIVSYTLIELLLENAHKAPLLSGDNTKWVSFLAAAKHWIAVLPPVISVVVLVSHPGSTAPFPKYLSVGLAWIATNNFLNHFTGMLGPSDRADMAEHSAMLLTINKLIAYLFLSNGFNGPRGKNRRGPPSSYVWGAVWFFLLAWEFLNRMELGLFSPDIQLGMQNIAELPAKFMAIKPLTAQGLLFLNVLEVCTLYYAVWRASACIGHGCSVYSHDAVPQHVGVVAMLFLVFANMSPILLDGVEHAWFTKFLPIVLRWVGGALLTTVGLWDAETFYE